MTNHDDEDARISAVALKNAQSILQARREAEDALRNRTDLLKITLDSIGDAVISADTNARVTFMNAAAEVLTGWTQAEALGRPLQEVFTIVHEHTRKPVDNPALRALQTGTVTRLGVHTLLIARDGTEKPIDDSAAPIRDDSGKSVGVVVIFRDVSERQLAEASQDRLSAIVDSSDDAIISKSAKGIIRSWNAGAERLFGYAAHEAIGNSIMMIIPQDRRDEEKEIIARILQGERVEHFETVRLTKHGQQVHVSLSISPVRDRAGRIIGASKIARDITAWKKAEKALREADQRKDEFIALLAHELRNPVAPLRNGLQVLRLAGDDKEAMAQARGMMERQLEHMVRLIDDLLDISRINQNKLELRRTRVLLADVVNSAVETARPAIDAAGHELVVSMPTDPVWLEADFTRLAQVFGNLVFNSAKYTNPGGRIWVSAVREGEWTSVVVRDTGIGIPASALTRIFDMFTQVDREIERATGGLGIGLALVKRLVGMHGGTVEVASPGLGKGSTFTVRLPILADRSPAPEESPVTEEVSDSGAKWRILVVDDNVDSATSMQIMLSLLGHDVRMVHDGQAAVEAAETFHPHAILMDIGMPVLNGYDAAKRIRQQPWGREMAIIALSGWGQSGDRQRSKEAGFSGHLVKPVALPLLHKMLAELTTAAPK